MDILDPFSALDSHTQRMLQDIERQQSIYGVDLLYAEEASRLQSTIDLMSDHASQYANMNEALTAASGLPEDCISAMERSLMAYQNGSHSLSGVDSIVQQMAMATDNAAAFAGLEYSADLIKTAERLVSTLGVDAPLADAYPELSEVIPDWFRNTTNLASSVIESATVSLLTNMTGITDTEEFFKHHADLMGFSDKNDFAAMLDAASALVINEPTYVSHVIDENGESESQHSPEVVDGSAHLRQSSSLTVNQRVFITLPQQKQREIIILWLTLLLGVVTLGFNMHVHYSGQDEKYIFGPVEEMRKISHTGSRPNTPEMTVPHHQRIIIGDGVRLREEPSTQAGILKQSLEPGLHVNVVAMAGNWLKIEYSFRSGEKTAGWVFAEYARPLKTLH